MIDYKKKKISQTNLSGFISRYFMFQKLKIVFLIFIVVLLLLLVFIITACFVPGFLKIKNYNVIGVSPELLHGTENQKFYEVISRKPFYKLPNTFLFPLFFHKEFKESLLEVFPTSSTLLSTDNDIKNKQLTINILDKGVMFSIFNVNGNYNVYANGMIVRNVNSVYVDIPKVVYRSQLEDGESFNKEDVIYVDFLHQRIVKGGYKLNHINCSIEKKDGVLSFRNSCRVNIANKDLSQTVDIMFLKNSDITAIINNFEKVLESGYNMGDLKYVDFRYGDKAYICKKDAECVLKE